MTRALQLPDNVIHVGVRIFLFLYRIKISKRLLLGKVVVSEIENVKYFELFYCRKNKTCYEDDQLRDPFPDCPVPRPK